MKRILFVCTGNTCRSPMAEAILKEKLKKYTEKYFISSAGINANNGRNINEKASNALFLLGIEYENFKSKSVDEKLINKYDIVLCMEEKHKNYINSIKKSEKTKVYTINEICGEGEIIDPYLKPLKEYIECSVKIEKSCEIIKNKLINNEL